MNREEAEGLVRDQAEKVITELATSLAARVPNLLWHYTDSAGFVGILSSGSMWATSHDLLNDSTEVTYGVGLARQVLDDLDLPADVSAAVAQSIDQSQLALVCVASLSELGDSLSQWRAYCPGYGGYALGFAGRALVQGVAEAMANHAILAKVIYDVDEQQQLLGRLIEPPVRALTRAIEQSAFRDRGDSIRAFADVLSFELHWLAPLLKHPAFVEEEEWRVVYRTVHGRELKYRSGPSGVVPYAEVRLAAEPNPLPLQKVRTAPHPNPDQVKRSTRWLLHTHGLLRTDNVVSSDVPYRSW